MADDDAVLGPVRLFVPMPLKSGLRAEVERVLAEYCAELRACAKAAQ